MPDRRYQHGRAALDRRRRNGSHGVGADCLGDVGQVADDAAVIACSPDEGEL